MTLATFHELIPASRKKAELETFLDSLGWPWNEEISRELDDCLKTLEVDDERNRN